MVSRRGVLTLIGGGVVVAAAGAAGGVAMVSAPSQTARAPWDKAGQYAEFRRRALSFALLAPNPHNRQPWLVKLEGDDALSLYVDLNRRLPETDPFDRQITIGCGAFLELLRQAAAQDRYGAEITPFPNGENPTTLDARPVARVRFTPGAGVPDPLFAHVLKRRSNKETYEPRDVAADALANLERAGQIDGTDSKTIANTALAASLRDLTWRAHQREVLTPAALQESIDLMRIGQTEVTANPDGITMEGPMITLGQWVGAVNRTTLADPQSTAFQQGLEMYRAKAMSARAFGWLINANASRTDQLNAGRAYVRVNLKATELGLAIHPWSQALQEYKEMSDLYAEARTLLGTDQCVQMLYRIGYAAPVMPAPRRGLDAHLV